MRICSDTDIYPETSCVRGPFLIVIIYSYLAAPFRETFQIALVLTAFR